MLTWIRILTSCKVGFRVHNSFHRHLCPHAVAHFKVITPHGRTAHRDNQQNVVSNSYPAPMGPTDNRERIASFKVPEILRKELAQDKARNHGSGSVAHAA